MPRLANNFQDAHTFHSYDEVRQGYNNLNIGYGNDYYSPLLDIGDGIGSGQLTYHGDNYGYGNTRSGDGRGDCPGAAKAGSPFQPDGYGCLYSGEYENSME